MLLLRKILFLMSYCIMLSLKKVEVGKGEPIEAGDYTVKTETTYDLIMRESEADLYIKTEKRTDKMFEATCVYKYVF